MEKIKNFLSKQVFAVQIFLLLSLNIIMRVISYPWKPNYLVFDEKYYVPQAVAMMYPAANKNMGERGYDLFKNVPGFMDTFESKDHAIYTTNIFQHPPFGKWLIGLGTLFYKDPTNYSGWRLSSVVASIIIVLVTMLLIKIILPNIVLAPLIAGLLVSVDGQLIVMGRMGMLDIFISMFVIIGTLFLVLCLKQNSYSNLYAILTGISFGLGTAVKWNTVLWALTAFVIVLVYAAVHRKIKYVFSAVLLLVSSAVAYLTTWFFSPVATGGFVSRFEKIVEYHQYVAGFLFKSDSSDGNLIGNVTVPFPLSWIVQKGDWGYSDCSNGTCQSILDAGNPVLWVGIWMSVLAIIAFIFFKRSHAVFSIPVIMLLMGVLPWFSGTRHPWLSYTVQILPLGVVCLTIIIALLLENKYGRILSGLYIIGVLTVSASMYPLWTMN